MQCHSSTRLLLSTRQRRGAISRTRKKYAVLQKILDDARTRSKREIPLLYLTYIYIYINDTLIHTYNNYILAALRASSFGEENMNTLLRLAPHTPGNAARAYKACGSFVESECAAQLFRYITNPWAHKHHHHHRIQLFNSFFFAVLASFIRRVCTYIT